jgi:hypothetical protein
MRQRAFVILNPNQIPRIDPAFARLASEKCSTSWTRRPSVRSPITVPPRGLGYSIGMIAVNVIISQKKARRERYCTDNPGNGR